MHTHPLPDSAGEFGEWKTSVLPCGKCGGKIIYRRWSSNCGGYEDVQLKCEGCKREWWVEGDDG